MKHLTICCKPVESAGIRLLIAALCILAPVARAQSTSDNQNSGAAISSTPGTMRIPSPEDQMGNMGGVNASQQAAIDKIFLKKAMQGNLAEAEMGELTLKKSNSEPVKQLARKMIDDHTHLNEQMKPVAQYLHVDIPTEVSKKDKSTISKMQGLSGPAYDQSYLKDVVKDHKQDLSEYRMEVSNGRDFSLKVAAEQGSKTIAGHLEMAQQLAKDENIDLAKK